DLALQEVESLARKYSALPNGNGPHQTGGAVDVLIVDKNGNSLDFGSEYCAEATGGGISLNQSLFKEGIKYDETPKRRRRGQHAGDHGGHDARLLDLFES
ncbi:MAG: hypothetical protein AAB217_23735, partial [Chloroflexota bacterium]